MEDNCQASKSKIADEVTSRVLGNAAKDPNICTTGAENENCSQDVFGDDMDFLEALPTTPENQIEPSTTPKRSRNCSIISKKKLSVGNTIPIPTKEWEELPGANEVFQQSSENENPKEVRDETTRKRSVGDKRKKRGNAAHGGPSKAKKKGKFKLAFTNRKAIIELANSASNELSKEELSYMTSEEKLQLSSWGLPSAILKNYQSKGITSLFQWQLECLANEKVLEGRNLLYSAPTSAGKTLVSEILMIKRVLELGRKAIMILPFVSVAREKVYNLQSIFGDAGVRVEGFMGSINPPGGFKAVDIAICTIEKANSLLNRLLEEGCLADLGTLVVDELHLIGDSHRGYLLELLLTKILYMTSVKNNGDHNSINMTDDASWRPRRFNIQVIGMSATLPNLKVLAKWLNAELYITEFRPVPLKETLKIDDKLLDEKLQPIRNVVTEDLPIAIPGDIDHIIYLALETVLNGFSVLIFCPTKALVEKTAEKLSTEFFEIGKDGSTYPPEIGEKLRRNLCGLRIKAVLDQLKQCPGGADNVLAKTIMFGIGYHHAGLTYENRDIVESAFKRGILKVIVATSTLSAGVNLPARRVMIVTPLFNRSVLDTLTYHQMCGRAGRNGIDTEGESILICPGNLKEQGMGLFRASMLPVKSALLVDGSLTSSMKRALLEAIASGIASLTTDVMSYAKCTFLFHCLDSGLYETDELSSSQLQKDSTIEECVKYLEKHEFIRIMRYEEEEKPDEYIPTQLGSACLAASLSPDDGLIVLRELQKARECFVLENELHVIYQVTPIYVSDTLRYIDWGDYLKIFDGLDDSQKKVAGLIGVREGFIARVSYGVASWSNPAHRLDMAIHQRFYAALALSDLVNEKSLKEVSETYGLNKGVLQNLQQSASTFAGMVTAFCGRLGWANLELLLSQFQERLEFGVQRELCDLVRLDCLNGRRARKLYDAGIKTVMELAATDPAQVEHILHKATPFESNEKEGSGSHIWTIGKETLSESDAAQKMVSEARVFIQSEFGHQGNLQFGFGFNDVPRADPSKSQQLRTSSAGLKVEVMSGVENKSKKNEEVFKIPPVPVSDDVDQEMRLINEVAEMSVHSQGRIHDNQSECEKFETERDVEMEELFTQRQFELETSKDICPQQQQREDALEDDMFEESMPEIVATDFSKLYAETNLQTSSNKFSLAGYIESYKSDKRDGEIPILQHSTPVVGSGRNPRFTLKHDEYTSPVRAIDSPFNNPEDDTVDGPRERNRDSIKTEVIQAEVHNEFEDLNAVDVRDWSKWSNQTEYGDKQLEASNRSLKLSESDAAAMKAIAEEDSKFESEELFTIPEEDNADDMRSTGTGNGMELASASPSIHPLNLPCSNSVVILDERIDQDQVDGFDDEDFILTQGPPASEEIMEADMFEESSSDTEQESTCTSQSASICSTDKTELVQETTLGKSKLRARIIQSVDMIPDDFFAASKLIGVGLRVVSSQVKSTGSIARQGIGARIVVKKPSNTSLHSNDNENQRPHSIALYNGLDTIWVLRWNNDTLMLGGKGGSNSNPKAKKLEALLLKVEANDCFMSLFDCKEKLRSLFRYCGSQIISKFCAGGKILDPMMAQWILDVDDENFNITKKKLIATYVKDETVKQISMLDWDKEIVDAYLAWGVMGELKKKLENTSLWNHFINTEMPSTIPLLLMEMNGFGLDACELNKLKRVLQFKSLLLELKAFQLAGCQFSLNSPNEIRKILFKHLNLKQPRGKGTGKAVLLKLDHELPRIILEYRKVSNALQKTVIPFQKERSLDTGRIHGQYSHFTATGRVGMSDPSLQCVPRDFDILVSYDEKEISEIKNDCRIIFGSKLNSKFQRLDCELGDLSIFENVSMISMRNAFIPCSNEFTILAADYSQLELRILAHLSGDSMLVEALNQDTDVFIEIASQWKNLPKDQITYSMRQEAKGIVYGVIYGMGSRALADQMEIEEWEADKFIREFMKTYPGVKSFLDKAANNCQKNEYVETMTGRRRYLPLINSSKQHEQAKARRQAVNTQIQGSAADLVKCAMTNIHSFLTATHPQSSLPIDWTKIAKARRSSSSLSLQGPHSSGLTSELENVVFFPILNLHDELIFEVRKTHLPSIARRIRKEMECCQDLLVKLPVVIKTGDTWGSLLTYDKL